MKTKALASLNIKPGELDAKRLINLLRLTFVTESSVLSSSIREKRMLIDRVPLVKVQSTVKIKAYAAVINILFVLKRYRLFNLNIKQPW